MRSAYKGDHTLELLKPLETFQVMIVYIAYL